MEKDYYFVVAKDLTEVIPELDDDAFNLNLIEKEKFEKNKLDKSLRVVGELNEVDEDYFKTEYNFNILNASNNSFSKIIPLYLIGSVSEENILTKIDKGLKELIEKYNLKLVDENLNPSSESSKKSLLESILIEGDVNLLKIDYKLNDKNFFNIGILYVSGENDNFKLKGDSFYINNNLGCENLNYEILEGLLQKYDVEKFKMDFSNKGKINVPYKFLKSVKNIDGTYEIKVLK